MAGCEFFHSVCVCVCVCVCTYMPLFSDLSLQLLESVRRQEKVRRSIHSVNSVALGFASS